MRPLVIGVTGGIASGKSTVLEELARLGAVTVSADEIARRVTEPDGPAYPLVVEAFGKKVVGPEGRLDRSALAARIFADPNERKRLEAILHPVILDEVRRELDAFRAHPPNDPPIAAVEIPLLYEVGAEGLVDLVLVVAVEHERQIQRLKQRKSWTDAVIQDALRSQMPLAEKAARADAVIHTDGDLADTQAQTQAFWNRILKL
jgi:dephospho-CoA kinase